MDALAKEYEIKVARQDNNDWLLLNTSLEVLQTTWINGELPKTQAVLQDIIIQDSAIDFGAIKSTSTITLNDNLSESIDIKRNWIRWARGNPVSVKVFDSTGIAYPIKSMFILDAKYLDGRKPLGEIPEPPSLRLELGDRLALRDIRDIATDDGGVTWSGIITFVDYLNQWLQYFGLPNLTFLPGEDTPNNLMVGPIPYSGGSVSDFLGKIAYGYTRRRLYCDHLGRMRLTKPISLTNPAFLDAHSDEFIVDLRSPTTAEMPAGKIIITATPDTAINRNALPDTTSVTTLRNLEHTETLRTRIFGNTETITRTATDRPIGITINGQSPRTKDWVETITRIFGGQHNALQSETTIRTEDAPPVSGGVSIGQVETKRVEKVFEYNDIIIKKITENVVRAESFSAGSSGGTGGSSSGVTVNNIIEAKIQEWLQRFQDIWAYLIHFYRPNEETDSVEPLSILGEGETQPPNTQFLPSTYVLSTNQITATADFSQTPGIDPKHKRTFDLAQFCPNQTQALAIATEAGQLMIGRYHGQNLAYPITDTWLHNPPEPIFNAFVLGEDDIQDAYLLNSHALFLGETESYGGGAGVWLGIRNQTTGIITPPYEFGTSRNFLRTTEGYLLNTTGNKFVIGV